LDRKENRVGVSECEPWAIARVPLSQESWLVVNVGAAFDVCRKLGLVKSIDEPDADPILGSAVVIEAASYFGRANPAIWSWIKTHWEGVEVG
jgi:hypothetical protein